MNGTRGSEGTEGRSVKFIMPRHCACFRPPRSPRTCQARQNRTFFGHGVMDAYAAFRLPGLTWARSCQARPKRGRRAPAAPIATDAVADLDDQFDRAACSRPRKIGMRRPKFREMAPMQPSTPRSYDLAVPTGDYPRETLMPVGRDAPEPHEGVQEQAPRLDNGAQSARCAHSI